MGLFYSYGSKSQLVGYADTGYLSDPHKVRYQTRYLFTYGWTAISWRSTKQTIAATSSNHAEILAIHEASRECFWLRSLIQYILSSCGLIDHKIAPTVLLKMIQHALLSLKADTSKVIEQSIFLPNSSSLMIFKIKGQLMYNRSAQVTIWQIYSQSHSQNPPLKDWCMRLGCADFEILNDVDKRRRLYSFFLGQVFFPLDFS